MKMVWSEDRKILVIQFFLALLALAIALMSCSQAGKQAQAPVPTGETTFQDEAKNLLKTVDEINAIAADGIRPRVQSPASPSN